MAVRLDKWLQVARVFKTRSRATRACKLGRVRVNDLRAKPHRSLEVDDRVEIELRDRLRVLVVKELAGRPLPKAEVPRLFDDRSPPPPDPDAPAPTPALRRERGRGRPTKKERREIERWRRG